MAKSGSEIAKGGFNNEEEVAAKFNNWKDDEDAQKWLEIMMYDLSEIEAVQAEKIGQRGFKSDINVTIKITIKKKNKETSLTSIENIQVKLVSNSKGFNQVEKRKVDSYIEKWHLTDDVVRLLKHYDGELLPYRAGTSSEKRMFVNEFTDEEQQLLMDFLQQHIVMIVSDIIRGRGRFAAEWTLVINKHDGYHWVLVAINEAIPIYLGDCKAVITSKGNIKLGNVTLQRKGGDNGADSANMLQFKADPMILFTEETRQYSSEATSAIIYHDFASDTPLPRVAEKIEFFEE